MNRDHAAIRAVPTSRPVTQGGADTGSNPAHPTTGNSSNNNDNKNLPVPSMPIVWKRTLFAFFVSFAMLCVGLAIFAVSIVNHNYRNSNNLYGTNTTMTYERYQNYLIDAFLLKNPNTTYVSPTYHLDRTTIATEADSSYSDNHHRNAVQAQWYELYTSHTTGDNSGTRNGTNHTVVPSTAKMTTDDVGGPGSLATTNPDRDEAERQRHQPEREQHLPGWVLDSVLVNGPSSPQAKALRWLALVSADDNDGNFPVVEGGDLDRTADDVSSDEKKDGNNNIRRGSGGGPPSSSLSSPSPPSSPTSYHRYVIRTANRLSYEQRYAVAFLYYYWSGPMWRMPLSSSSSSSNADTTETPPSIGGDGDEVDGDHGDRQRTLLAGATSSAVSSGGLSPRQEGVQAWQIGHLGSLIRQRDRRQPAQGPSSSRHAPSESGTATASPPNTTMAVITINECDWVGITCNEEQTDVIGLNFDSATTTATATATRASTSSEGPARTQKGAGPSVMDGDDAYNQDDDDDDEYASVDDDGGINDASDSEDESRHVFVRNAFRKTRIPPELGLFRQLRVLQLSRRGLIGRIPETVYQGLQQLQRLDLSENQLTSFFTPSLGLHWTQLSHLDVSFNQLQDKLHTPIHIPKADGVNSPPTATAAATSNPPPSVVHDDRGNDGHNGATSAAHDRERTTSTSTKTTTTTLLDLYSANLKQLRTLRVSENKQLECLPVPLPTGGIDEADSTPNATDTESTTASSASETPTPTSSGASPQRPLVSFVEKVLVSWPHIEELDVINTRIVTILSELKSPTKLRTFEASGTPIQGSIPSSIGAYAPDLETFSVWAPARIDVEEVTGEADDSNRDGTGSSTSPTIRTVSYGGGLRGTIPTEIGSLRNLVNLELDWNPLKTTIPTELGRLDKLEMLSIASIPGLTGTIPTEISRLSSLTYLYISGTSLEGTVPSALAQCSHLRRVEMHDTNLVGTMPIGMCQRIDDRTGYYKPWEVLIADCAGDHSSSSSSSFSSGGTATTISGKTSNRNRNDSGNGYVECDCCTRCN